MIFTRIYIDNVYNFHEATLDLTLKRHIKNNPIEYEYLENRPNFKFKRVCILSGANASGKTSLGKIMTYIHSVIYQSQFSSIKHINETSRDAVIEVEYISSLTNTIRYLKIEQNVGFNYPNFIFASMPILKNDSNAQIRKRLMQYVKKENIKRSGNLTKNPERVTWSSTRRAQYIKIPHSYRTERIEIRELRELREQFLQDNYGWYYLFSNIGDIQKMDIPNSPHLDTNVFLNILKTFDSSIMSIKEIQDGNSLAGYSIKFLNEDMILIDKEGNVTDKNRLSMGTYDAIRIAEFVAWIIARKKENNNASFIYFLDEKMAYSHSEIEKTIVNLIIQNMGRNSQFFYTTHNYDILDLNLPIHSYVFLKKEEDKAFFIQPENTFKKNDRSLLNYVQNDVFNTMPNISLIEDLY